MRLAFTKTKTQHLLLLAFVMQFFGGCQKEIAKPDSQSPKPNQQSTTSTDSKTLDYLNRMKSAMERNSIFMSDQLKKNRAQMALILRKVETINTARIQLKASRPNTSTTNASYKNVINVPGDYSNLQDAINYYFLNAPNAGGKIIIKGAITVNSDVAIDVPNLVIQGSGCATLNGVNGSALQFLAKRIEVSHLNLNVDLVINSVAQGANLHDNTISSTDSTGTNMLIAIHGASNCNIDNNTIREGITGNNSTALFSDGGCIGNEFGNDKILNFATGLLNFGPPFDHFYSSGAGLQFTGDNDPVIQNCFFNNNVTGINFLGCTKATVKNCILNITPTSFGNGVFDQPVTDVNGNILTASANTQINNCAINPKVTVYPAYYSAIGIALTNSTNPVVTNCSAIYAGNGISLFQCTNAKLTNDLWNFNETGIADLGSAGTVINKNVSSSNQFFGLLTSESAVAIPPDYIYLITVPETNAIFENCTCNLNGLDGMSIEGTSGCTLKNCVANKNARWGILVEQVTIVLNIPPYNQTVTIPSINNKIINNSARNNVVVDYNQINSTGITLTGNNFGTTSIN